MRPGTPGRNDPCPCGSGKKYKKCCLGKTAQETAAIPAMPAESRFHSPVTSYYTQAALEEALQPGGLVQIHPYVLIKLRDDPGMLEGAGPKVRAGIQQMWLASRVARMTNEEIESRLGLIGVLSYNRADFVESAKGRQSAWLIAEEWGRPLAGLSLADQDFLGLAACELWRRFCPDHSSLEMIDDWVCEGYGLLHQQKPSQAMASWWKVWEALRPRLTPEMGSLNEAGEELFPRMSQCLSNWCVDFRLELRNASVNDKECGEIGVRFIREVLQALPKEETRSNLLGDLGELLFHLQRNTEAEQCCEKLFHDYPDQAIGYVTLADGLLGSSFRGACDPPRIQRAIGVLEAALARPVKDAEDYDVAKRLFDARELLSKASSSG
jgi:SEC-C motif-containing protein